MDDNIIVFVIYNGQKDGIMPKENYGIWMKTKG